MFEEPAFRRKRKGWLGAVLAFTCALVLAACGSDGSTSSGVGADPVTTDGTTTVSGTAPSQTSASSAGELTVWFLDVEGQSLVTEARPSPSKTPELRDALVALADGPQTPAAIPALPTGTQIVGTNVTAGEALVNLSEEFVTGYPTGGAAAEIAVLAPLVYTATAIDGVQSVRLTVQGQVPDLPGSQFDFTRALTRQDFPNLEAP